MFTTSGVLLPCLTIHCDMYIMLWAKKSTGISAILVSSGSGADPNSITPCTSR